MWSNRQWALLLTRLVCQGAEVDGEGILSDIYGHSVIAPLSGRVIDEIGWPESRLGLVRRLNVEVEHSTITDVPIKLQPNNHYDDTDSQQHRHAPTINMSVDPRWRVQSAVEVVEKRSSGLL